MKGFIVFLVIGGVGLFLASRFLTGQVFQDPGRTLPFAWEVLDNDHMLLHVGVPPILPLQDPPPSTPAGIVLWDDWIQSHFIMTDASGHRVAFKKIGTSSMMTGKSAAGAPEFALETEIKKGDQFTFELIPRLDKPERYFLEFAAPTEQQDVRRRRFMLKESE